MAKPARSKKKGSKTAPKPAKRSAASAVRKAAQPMAMRKLGIGTDPPPVGN